MTQYSKINLVYRLQKWMDSVPGQTFLNYAYSWGAAVVILGTLFKLTHLPGANFMLFLGMGTEVVVFFLSAFDRPFDKTADGRDLPTHLTAEEGEGVPYAAQPETLIVGGGGGSVSVQTGAADDHDHTEHAPYVAGGGTVVIGSLNTGAPASGASVASVASSGESPAASTSGTGMAPDNVSGTVGQPVVAQYGSLQTSETSSEMAEATNNYVEELKKLTETLGKVSEQSARLTTDSEEMENLNRTLTGICKVYEMQLKSASSQITTIDQINEQTKKMAEQIEQLNRIYARMIESMTVVKDLK